MRSVHRAAKAGRDIAQPAKELLQSLYLLETDADAAAYIGGGAVILAVTVLAIAMIVRADVQARSSSTVALYGARAHVATTFLNAAMDAAEWQTAKRSAPSDGVLHALAAFPKLVKVKRAGGAEVPVSGIRFDETEGLQIRADDDWISTAQVESFTAQRVP